MKNPITVEDWIVYVAQEKAKQEKICVEQQAEAVKRVREYRPITVEDWSAYVAQEQVKQEQIFAKRQVKAAAKHIKEYPNGHAFLRDRLLPMGVPEKVVAQQYVWEIHRSCVRFLALPGSNYKRAAEYFGISTQSVWSWTRRAAEQSPLEKYFGDRKYLLGISGSVAGSEKVHRPGNFSSVGMEE